MQFLECVVPENLNVFHLRKVSTSPPLWKFHLASYISLNVLVLQNPPHPQEIPIASVGEYGYFLELQKIHSFEMERTFLIFRKKLHVSYNFCFFADSRRFIDCDWSLWFSIRSGNSNRNSVVIVNQVTRRHQGWR